MEREGDFGNGRGIQSVCLVPRLVPWRVKGRSGTEGEVDEGCDVGDFDERSPHDVQYDSAEWELH